MSAARARNVLDQLSAKSRVIDEMNKPTLTHAQIQQLDHSSQLIGLGLHKLQQAVVIRHDERNPDSASGSPTDSDEYNDPVWLAANPARVQRALRRNRAHSEATNSEPRAR